MYMFTIAFVHKVRCCWEIQGLDPIKHGFINFIFVLQCYKNCILSFSPLIYNFWFRPWLVIHEIIDQYSALIREFTTLPKYTKYFNSHRGHNTHHNHVHSLTSCNYKPTIVFLRTINGESWRVSLGWTENE